MHRILLTATAVLALAACGGPDADENPGDLNVVDNTLPPGNAFEVPTGEGPSITPTGNGVLIEPGGNQAVTGATPANPTGGGNAGATGGNAVGAGNGH